MRIEIFYIEGCPNHQPTLDRVHQIVEEMALTVDVLNVQVADSDSARVNRFLGSPTVHVDGVDVDPSVRTSSQFGFMCRTYLHAGQRQGVPPADLIRRTLLKSIA